MLILAMDDASPTNEPPSALPTRVLFVTNESTYLLGHRMPLIRRLQQAGVQLHVITDAKASRASWPADIPLTDRPIPRFRLSVSQDSRFFWTVFNSIRKQRPDLVHAITVKGNVLAAAAVQLARITEHRRLPLVMTVPGLGRVFARTQAGAGAHIRRWLVSRVLAGAARSAHTALTFENPHDRAVYRSLKIVDRRRGVVTRGAGINPAAFTPHRPRPNGTKNVTVLFAGRLLRSKGLDLVLAAADALAQSHPSTRFLIAGGPTPGDPDCVDPNQLEGRPNVIALGHVDTLPELMACADIFCLPTRYGEGLPRSLMEAAASGCAVVASRHPGCRAFVRSGQTGLLIDAEGPGAAVRLTDAIVRLIEDPSLRGRLAQHGLSRVRDDGFDQTAVVDHFLETYRAALCGTGP